ncbi:hypothetical protein BX666DRAFT_1917168 [Dichotomocladium elegans]|nr:hypothetical protein BX666DRAFT_1917168 [Dichotomocladium elegans]
MSHNSEASKSSESFVVFGTAFPEQTERDRRAGLSDSGQFVPLWKQEVRDEKGRRRFHGAFTGGFSAGYFNTVGSKEGWTPSSFVSSRSSRSEKRDARPEDFMDEEDLQELAGAKKLVATEEFDILGSTEREMAARKRQQEEDEARGGVGFLGASLMGLVQPMTDSVGVKLLRKLGWKPGQGIGPRMTRRQRKMAFHQTTEEDDEDDGMDNDVTFAPRDTPIESYTTKTNTYGLGYDLAKYVPQVAEMRRLRELGTEVEGVGAMEEKTGKRSRGAFGSMHSGGGFGLGAFEDEDEDVDVYGDVRMRDYHHTLYEDDGDIDIQHRKKQEHRANQVDENQRPVNKAKCSDGRYPLRGFAVSTKSQELGKWYRPPDVPADFDGRHGDARHADIRPNDVRYNLTADERGAILGEKPIEPRSVFDYIPENSKDRLDNVLKFMVHKRPIDPTKLTDFPKVSKHQANQALRGFMPFGDNPKKQARYRKYLENMAGMMSEDGEPMDTLPVPEGLEYEEAMKEMDEFAKAARIFRPISAMMSGRFTTATTTVMMVGQGVVQGGLKTETEWRKEKKDLENEQREKEPEKEKSQEAQAAAMKMFGQLTRTVKPFYPTKLLCKRFNVRNPHPDYDPTRKSDGHTMSGSREVLSEESVENIMRLREKPRTFEQWQSDPALGAIIPKPSERPKAHQDTVPEPTSSLALEKTSTSAELESTTADAKKEGSAEEKDKEEYERPSMDIFKAIFDVSDDDDDDDDGAEVAGPINGVSQGMGAAAEKQAAPALSTKDDKENGSDDEALIGPPPPPPASATAESKQLFRPKFVKPSERVEDRATSAHRIGSSMTVASERVVVQPFKARERVRRRHVSVSDDDEDEVESEEERRSRHKKKHKKEERRHHHRKKEKKKKEKKRKSSRSRRSTDDEEWAEDSVLNQAYWVEKEPVHRPDETRKGGSSNSKGLSRSSRARAADLW